MKPDVVAFSEALASRLSQRRMSPAELARRCGVARSTVCRLLSGERPPTSSLIGRVAGALAVERSVLVAGTDAAGRAVEPPADQLAELLELRAQLEEDGKDLVAERLARESAQLEADALRRTLRRIRSLAAGGSK